MDGSRWNTLAAVRSDIPAKEQNLKQNADASQQQHHHRDEAKQPPDMKVFPWALVGQWSMAWIEWLL